MRSVSGKLVLTALLVLSGAHFLLAEDSVFQLGTMDALRLGVFQGDSSCRRLKRFGNFGLGTFDGLDGEMIVLGDKIFQVRPDGRPTLAQDSTPVPFAVVVPFHTDAQIQITQPTAFSDFQKLIDGILPSPNYVYAIRVTGSFQWVDARSEDRQRPPYPTLDEALRTQTVFHFGALAGTLVGFRFPAYVGGVNAAGYHFHFISDDEQAGGHFLDGVLQQGTIEIGRYRDFRLVLPENDAFRKAVAPVDGGGSNP